LLITLFDSLSSLGRPQGAAPTGVLIKKVEMSQTEKIILFDGVCNLCSGMVIFTIKRDPQAKIKYASLQSQSGQALLKKFNLPVNDFNSFVFVVGDTYYRRSSATLRVLKELGWFWRLFFVFIIVPPFIRDFVYAVISNNRYRVFGKKEFCMTPSPEIKQRFLE
jgi:predicted DCC family thiol-disulfide oxidoreductase YuxK